MKRIGFFNGKRVCLVILIILLSNITYAGASFVQTAPTLDIWYADDYSFGHVGTPQTWINIMGNVSDPDGLDINTLQYTLNGTFNRNYKIGPDNRRLAEAGDFNLDIEITNGALISGTNILEISAADTLGNYITETVTFEYTEANSWPLPYTADWNTTDAIHELGQVVDGDWIIEDGGVRPTDLDYDRVVAIGDLDWTDYTVTTPITIHGLDSDSDAFGSISQQPAIGIITHWQGHTGFGQPKQGYTQFGALGWITWQTPSNDYIQMLAPDRELDTAPIDITFGETYLYKMQVESQVGDVSIYRLKIWHEDDPEPATWMIEEFGEEIPPKSGSLMLTAHHVDATFGRVLVQTNAESDNPTLTVNVSGNGATTRDLEFPYAQNEAVEVTAVPDPGWIFSGWTGDVTSSDNPLTITLDTDKTITAVFIEEPPELTTNVSGNGSVDRSADAPYTSGQTVDLTAVPDTGWEFVNWTGDIMSSSNPISVTLNNDITVTAVFTAIVPSLTTSATGNGNVTRSADSPYTYNQAVELTATPDTGWEFASWGGDISSTDNPVTVNLTEDMTVTAEFTQITPSLSTNTSGNGTVSRDDNGPYSYGDMVELTANPAGGWVFVNWTGDVSSTDNPLSITLTEDTTVTAVFTQPNPDLTTNTNGNGSVQRSANAPYTVGEMVDLTAVPAQGWQFSHWTGDASGSANPLTVTLNDDTTVTAVFTQIPPKLTINTNGDGSVLRDDAGPYTVGQSVELTATADPGWEFSHWAGDASGSDNPLRLTLNSDKTVTAVFTQIPVSLTYTTSGNGAVSVSVSGPYVQGQQVVLTATPAAGWVFAGWSGDVSSTNNPLVLTLDDDRTVQALFVLDTPTAAENTIFLPLVVTTP